MMVVNDVRGIPARIFVDGVLEHDESVDIGGSEGNFNIFVDL